VISDKRFRREYGSAETEDTGEVVLQVEEVDIWTFVKILHTLAAVRTLIPSEAYPYFDQFGLYCITQSSLR
jgi:hypothetical protein